MKTISSGCVFLPAIVMLNRGFDHEMPFTDPRSVTIRHPYFGQKLGSHKKTTILIGSFVLSLAVPTGLESAVRNWFIEWVSMMRMIALCHL